MIGYPAFALVPAVGFLGLYLRTRQRATLVAAVTWAAYGAYELGMTLRILCTGECNIRVDLLLIYPVLVVLSLVAVWRAARTILKDRRSPRP